MILVTGGTGFVGQALVQHLVAMGKAVRILLRPSSHSPNLPRGIPVEVALSSLRDERGLRAAMKGVDAVYHLVSDERRSLSADLTGIDIDGSQAVATAASQVGIDRFIYLSHIGADRASAFPVLRSKGYAEAHIMHSGLNYTILRSAAIFGPNDQFTVPVAKLLKRTPFVFFIPGDGSALLQPIWIDDVVACLAYSQDDPKMFNQIYEIGGGEYFQFRQIVEIIQASLRIKRRLVSVTPAYLRPLGVYLEQTDRNFPISLYWLDSLAVDRTCAVDTLPRLFGLIPARFRQNLTYLEPTQRK